MTFIHNLLQEKETRVKSVKSRNLASQAQHHPSLQNINPMSPPHLVHDHLGLGNLQLLLARFLLHRLKFLDLRTIWNWKNR